MLVAPPPAAREAPAAEAARAAPAALVAVPAGHMDMLPIWSLRAGPLLSVAGVVLVEATLRSYRRFARPPAI